MSDERLLKLATMHIVLSIIYTHGLEKVKSMHALGRWAATVLPYMLVVEVMGY